MTVSQLRHVVKAARSRGRRVSRQVRSASAPIGAATLERARAVPVPAPVRVAASKALLRRPWSVSVPIDSLLLGAQSAMTADEYAEKTGNLLWPSTRVIDGPHATLLRAARDADGELSDADILASEYGAMIRDGIDRKGYYLWATDDASAVALARSYLDSLNGHQWSRRVPAQTAPGEPILVAPIQGSRYYQVLDGHHRVALAGVQGAAAIDVTTKWARVSTPLQRHLRKMSWLEGDRTLYQPLDAPELVPQWRTVRKCTDRMQKMTDFLTTRQLVPPTTSSSLDVASFYGWFVARFRDLGYAAEGIERDPLALPVGEAAYGLEPGVIHVGDCEDFLTGTDRQWDVVSCFSLLHHFVLGRGQITAEELVRLLDSVTGKVLFLDTGQDHEAWFSTSLAGWDTDHVKAFLTEHTTFDEVLDLGPDSDAVAPYADNYGRHLFACVRR